MGNIGSNNSTGRRRHRGGNSRRNTHHTAHTHTVHTHHQPPPPPPPQPLPPPQPDITGRYVFAAATPYPNPNPPPYYQYPGPYYPPPPPPPPAPAPLPAAAGGWVGGRYPCAPVMHIPTPYIDHQKAVTIRNDVNLKKESLKLEADEENPGKFVVSFTFDSTVACSITLYFFAKEGEDCNLTTAKDASIQPLTLTFQEGLGQKFKQAPGTGIDLSAYEESELSKGNETSVYPLAVKAEATPSSPESGNRYPGATTNSQITDAVFEKVKGEFKVKVVKQILWVNGIRYELQEIYGIGNSVDGSGFDGNDSSKECVICLSEPRDTTVLPCRHMCMCSGCAKVLRFQTNRCPICRQAIERLLEIKINNRADE